MLFNWNFSQDHPRGGKVHNWWLRVKIEHWTVPEEVMRNFLMTSTFSGLLVVLKGKFWKCQWMNDPCVLCGGLKGYQIKNVNANNVTPSTFPGPLHLNICILDNRPCRPARRLCIDKSCRTSSWSYDCPMYVQSVPALLILYRAVTLLLF